MSIETELAEAMRARADAARVAQAASLANIEQRLASPARRRPLILVGGIAAALILVAAATLATRSSPPSEKDKLVTLAPPEIAGLGQPISGERRAAFERHTGSSAPAYLVGEGKSPSGDWWAVGYMKADGQLCEAIIRFGAYGESCEMSDLSSHQINLGTDGTPPYVVTSIVGPDVRSIVAYTDTGVSLSAPAVLVEAIHAAFVAYQAPADWPQGGHRVDFVDADGKTSVDPRAEVPLVVDQQCAGAESPRRGGPAARLPKAGDTAQRRVRRIADERRDEILRRYRGSWVHADPRYGQVADGGRVLEAGDYLIRVGLSDASLCPSAPASIDGVPLSFVYPSTAPPSGVGNQKQPAAGPRGEPALLPYRSPEETNTTR